MDGGGDGSHCGLGGEGVKNTELFRIGTKRRKDIPRFFGSFIS